MQKDVAESWNRTSVKIIIFSLNISMRHCISFLAAQHTAGCLDSRGEH